MYRTLSIPSDKKLMYTVEEHLGCLWEYRSKLNYQLRMTIQLWIAQEVRYMKCSRQTLLIEFTKQTFIPSGVMRTNFLRREASLILITLRIIVSQTLQLSAREFQCGLTVRQWNAKPLQRNFYKVRTSAFRVDCCWPTIFLSFIYMIFVAKRISSWNKMHWNVLFHQGRLLENGVERFITDLCI